MILFVAYLLTFAVSFTVVKAKEKLYISIQARGFLSCLYTVYMDVGPSDADVALCQYWWWESDGFLLFLPLFWSRPYIVSCVTPAVCAQTIKRLGGLDIFMCILLYTIHFLSMLVLLFAISSHVLVIIFSKELLRLSYNAPSRIVQQ